MNSMMDSAVIIQASSHSVPSTTSWFGEVVLITEYLRKQGVLSKLNERVRFRRRPDQPSRFSQERSISAERQAFPRKGSCLFGLILPQLLPSVTRFVLFPSVALAF